MTVPANYGTEYSVKLQSCRKIRYIRVGAFPVIPANKCNTFWMDFNQNIPKVLSVLPVFLFVIVVVDDVIEAISRSSLCAQKTLR